MVVQTVSSAQGRKERPGLVRSCDCVGSFSAIRVWLAGCLSGHSDTRSDVLVGRLLHACLTPHCSTAALANATIRIRGETICWNYGRSGSVWLGKN